MATTINILDAKHFYNGIGLKVAPCYPPVTHQVPTHSLSGAPKSKGSNSLTASENKNWEIDSLHVNARSIYAYSKNMRFGYGNMNLNEA